MTETYECFECQDRGFIPTPGGTYIKCRCTLKKELLNFLGEYKDFKIIQSVKAKYKSYLKDTIFKEQEYKTFGSFVKSILTLSYLDKLDNDFYYSSISGNDLIDGIFTSDEFGNKTNATYYDANILILKLGRDNQNKALPDLLSNLLTYRQEHKLPTFIYVYPEVNATRLENYYGKVAMKIISGYKSLKTKGAIV